MGFASFNASYGDSRHAIAKDSHARGVGSYRRTSCRIARGGRVLSAAEGRPTVVGGASRRSKMTRSCHRGATLFATTVNAPLPDRNATHWRALRWRELRRPV
jgi:hypothetical protein